MIMIMAQITLSTSKIIVKVTISVFSARQTPTAEGYDDADSRSETDLVLNDDDWGSGNFDCFCKCRWEEVNALKRVTSPL